MHIPSSLSEQLATRGVAYAPQIASAAQRYGLNPALLAAVAAQETGGPESNRGANIVGDDGHGHGLFQIDDRWHTFAQSTAAMDPAKNADYAAAMLSNLLHRFGGNVKEALSSYNAGSPDAIGTTTRWQDGKVLGYADSVLRHYRNIVGVKSDLKANPPSLLDGCRAEHARDAESIGALASQASSLPLIGDAAASSSLTHQHRSPGTDATGHAREQQIADADLID